MAARGGIGGSILDWPVKNKVPIAKRRELRCDGLRHSGRRLTGVRTERYNDRMESVDRIAGSGPREPFRIAIIGGGPAGSFTAHFLDKFAAAQGRELKLDIYDYKNFLRTGKRNCNMCAGIISATLVKKMADEHIVIPPSVIKNEIGGYHLHTNHNTVHFNTVAENKIYAVFRSGGPPVAGQKSESFDQFLLDHVARNPAVTILNRKVTGIEFSPAAVAITTEDQVRARYDFVVGAFGVNTALKDIIRTGYVPPRTVKFRQFEMYFDEEFIKRIYRDRVHMFPIYRRGIWFITLTPKANFVTVTAMGDEIELDNLKAVMIDHPALRRYVPVKQLEVRCTCVPEIPVGIARHPYAERFLIVGDACISRYLKNGIESAWQTAYLAADTVINHGVTEAVLRRYYFSRCRRMYRFDNLCGRVLFFMNRMLFINSVYTEAHMFVAKREQITPGKRPLSGVFWDMFTGDKPYRTILANALRPGLIYAILKQFVTLCLLVLVKGKTALRLPLSAFHRLLKSSTVAIIGGGPAGAACAIKLAQLARAKGLQLNIVLYERKDFTRHHNQCVGVLSPPILQILERELGITLPPGLIRSEIPGYELHTEQESIFLTNYRPDHSPTYSLRRVEFDNYLLECVRNNGVKVVNSRVTDLEFCRGAGHDTVRIFSESDFMEASVVVGAFGLDREMLARWSEATGGRYQPPRKIIKSFVTRIGLPAAPSDRLPDNRIHAFLPASVRTIEFGAITVKDDHIVVNIAGEHSNSLDLAEFLSLAKVRELVPAFNPLHLPIFCGSFPAAPAKNPYGDRYITVGDTTGWLRPLKGKGINLAIITGIRAAEVMMRGGIARRNLKKYEEQCSEFISDYKYGNVVRLLLRLALRTGLLDLFIRRAKKDARFYNMLYDAVSAEAGYQTILRNFLSPSGRGTVPPAG